MRKTLIAFERFRKDEEGAALIEYTVDCPKHGAVTTALGDAIDPNRFVTGASVLSPRTPRR